MRQENVLKSGKHVMRGKHTTSNLETSETKDERNLCSAIELESFYC